MVRQDPRTDSSRNCISINNSSANKYKEGGSPRVSREKGSFSREAAERSRAYRETTGIRERDEGKAGEKCKWVGTWISVSGVVAECKLRGETWKPTERHWCRLVHCSGRLELMIDMCSPEGVNLTSARIRIEPREQILHVKQFSRNWPGFAWIDPKRPLEHVPNEGLRIRDSVWETIRNILSLHFAAARLLDVFNIFIATQQICLHN